MNDSDKKMLLIAGIPAAGKSHFCAWLAENHGFVHVDPERPGCLDELSITGAWGQALRDDDPTELLSALRALGPRVVLDWGFPPHRIDFVEELKEIGVALWWFDADHGRAREEVIGLRAGSQAALDIQMPAIQERSDHLRELFHPNIILVLDSAGRRMDSNDIWQAISRRTA
jgi:hypothetical protein